MAAVDLPEVDLTAKPPVGQYRTVETRWGAVRVHLRETPVPDGADTHDTAVYLHGLAGSATNWTDLSRLLGERMRGIAVDLPGFGWTAPPAGFEHGHGDYAEIVIRLLEQRDPGGDARPVHLLGNSFGGTVAMEVAARRPDLVATLTLLAPAVPDLRPDVRRVAEPRAVLAALPLVGRGARRKLARVSSHERAVRMLRLCFAVPEAVPSHRVREFAEEVRSRAGLPWAGRALWRTTMGLLRSWLRPPWRSLWRTCRAVRAPTLVIWGADDQLISVRKAPLLTKRLPNARLLVLPRTGHVPQLERPGLVARAVRGLVHNPAW